MSFLFSPAQALRCTAGFFLALADFFKDPTLPKWPLRCHRAYPGPHDFSLASALRRIRIRDTLLWRILYNPAFNMGRTPSIPFLPAYSYFRVATDAMISILSFVTLALAGMVVATPLKRAPAVSSSKTKSNPLADCPNQSQISFVVDA